VSNFAISVKLEEKGFNLDALDAGMVESFQVAVGGIAKAAHREWVRLAQARLGTSREIYIGGLRQAESFTVKSLGTSPIFEIQLVGTMPNNFEFGMSPFDMKGVRPGWLGGSKARTAKDGHKYVIIPFRHSKSSDARLGYSGKAKAVSDPDLKTQLRAATKKYGLDRMMRTATGKVVEGSVARIPAKAPVHPYLQGLTRIQKGNSGTTKTGKQTGAGGLMTWRVMSENSPASSWQHPGVKAANLLPEVEAWVDKELDKVIETILGV
jgi:uncharacterized protein YwbE